MILPISKIATQLLSTVLAGSLLISLSNPALADNHKNKNNTVYVNKNVKVNKNGNVHVNKNVNVHTNNHHNKGYYKNGHYYSYDNNNNNGVSTAAAIAIGVAGLASGIAIGTLVGKNKMPPTSSCTSPTVGGVNYLYCNDTWYRAQGTSFVVVASPY